MCFYSYLVKIIESKRKRMKISNMFRKVIQLFLNICPWVWCDIIRLWSCLFVSYTYFHVKFIPKGLSFRNYSTIYCNSVCRSVVHSFSQSTPSKLKLLKLVLEMDCRMKMCLCPLMSRSNLSIGCQRLAIVLLRWPGTWRLFCILCPISEALDSENCCCRSWGFTDVYGGAVA